MGRRSIRLALVVVGLLATAGLGYRLWLDEEEAVALAAAVDGTTRAAAESLESLAGLGAALGAQLVEGQRPDEWATRVNTLTDDLRQRVLTLDAALAAGGGSLGDLLNSLDQIGAANTRARDYLDNGQALLAGDVIFTEVRDLLASSRQQIATASATIARAQATRARALHLEQAMLAGGIAGVWLLVALLLIPTGATAAAATAAAAGSFDLRDMDVSIESPRAVDAGASNASGTSGTRSTSGTAPEAPTAPVAPAAPALTLLSEVCSDLSSLNDAGALGGALDRAGRSMDAAGLIVWLASTDGAKLTPVASSGFDPRVLARVGSIPRDGDNVTAAAFREAAVRTTSPGPSRPAAVAAAMCGPSGAVGVLSVELKPGVPADAARAAYAAILAAQLSTLALPMPAASVDPADPAVPQQAQA